MGAQPPRVGPRSLGSLASLPGDSALGGRGIAAIGEAVQLGALVGVRRGAIQALRQLLVRSGAGG
jgi:hypothetical protein